MPDLKELLSMATEDFSAHLRSINGDSDFCDACKNSYERGTACQTCASAMGADTSFDDLGCFDEPIVLAEPEPDVTETVENVTARLNLYFPFDAIRPAQTKMLQAVAAARVTEKKFTLLEGPTGSGKCLAPTTPVMMADGSIKQAQDIAVGDALMGPDSQPRKVLSTTHGYGEMFRVEPSQTRRPHFEPYEVNADHVLTLQYSEGVTPSSFQQPDGTVELSVAEYMAQSDEFKKCVKSYKVGVFFAAQAVPLDPYLVGLWLGDGASVAPSIPTADHEIRQYVGNEQFPLQYLYNSRAVQLSVLAGLIDWDGYQGSKGGIQLSTKYPAFAGQLVYLCRSLGFAASLRYKRKLTGPRFNPYIISVFGAGMHEIPTRIHPKQIKARTPQTDALVGGLTITSVGMGPYHGFMLDGDGLFLLGDFTVTHNSGISICAGLHSTEHPTPDPREYQPGAYILTSQKALSAQMVSDFGGEGLVELRGKSNYTCDRHQKNCELGSLSNLGHKTCDMCPYKVAKNKFIGASLGITNYAYFIKETSSDKSQLPLREHLILDEAHNVEREILSVASTTIGSKQGHLLNDFESVPRFEAGQEVKVRDWISTKILPEQEKYIFGIKKALFKAEVDKDQQRAGVLKRDLSEAEQYQDGLLRFTLADNLRDWIAWTDAGILNIRPLSPARYAQEMLFSKAKHILLMSATILDFKTFRRTLGIKPSQAVSYQAPSEFPVENRRIIFWPAGSMSYKNIQETTPKLHARCAALLKKNFAEMKGIIHTHNYKINESLFGSLCGAGLRDRLITHDRTPESREQAIQQHLASPLNTVLISPSMTEGLDLKYDLSRFQILCKVPFPYLDPYNKARLERDPGWYSLQAAVTLVQATGRSIRSADDSALTVILDSDFSRLLNDARDILPEWWKQAIEVK